MAEIRWIYKFPNGNVMVFDSEGKQMPEYQGQWEEKKEKILKDKPPTVEVEDKVWR